MYFAPYIDASGVHIPTYTDRLEALVSAYRHIFGNEANLEISSPDYQLLAVFARALDDLSQIILADFASRNPQYASGAALDLLLPLHGLSRGGASYSTVNLSLTGTPEAVLPAAPQVLDDAGHIWVCPSAGIHMDEEGKALVTAVCSTPGAISAPAGTVRRLVSPVSGLASAVNPAPAVPGTEAETDASCRNRLRAAAAAPSLGTLDAIRQGVLSVAGVTACEVLEMIPRRPTAGASRPIPSASSLPGATPTTWPRWSLTRRLRASAPTAPSPGRTRTPGAARIP